MAAAEGLLDELDDGWLRDQVVGLRTADDRRGIRSLEKAPERYLQVG